MTSATMTPTLMAGPAMTGPARPAALGTTIAVAQSLAIWSGERAYVGSTHPDGGALVIALDEELRPADGPGVRRLCLWASVTPAGAIVTHDPTHEARLVSIRPAGGF